MPELPEVEVIRRGLSGAVDGAIVEAVDVLDPRALKRHRPRHDLLVADVATDFETHLRGARLLEPQRRGKFMWIPIAGSQDVLLTHLGMSGQLLLRTPDQDDARHVRVRLWLETTSHGLLRLDFADQRLFGSLAIDALDVHADEPPIPSQVVHIAPDPLEESFCEGEVRSALARKKQAIKPALLDQTLMSGIGNIYADEALWMARIHPATESRRLSSRRVTRLLDAIREVFAKALAEGGTSFDALYVNVNGESGYFAHSLNAYGRAGQPCPRCGTTMRRISIANRSSHVCPRCQRTP